MTRASLDDNTATSQNDPQKQEAILDAALERAYEHLDTFDYLQENCPDDPNDQTAYLELLQKLREDSSTGLGDFATALAPISEMLSNPESAEIAKAQIHLLITLHTTDDEKEYVRRILQQVLSNRESEKIRLHLGSSNYQIGDMNEEAFQALGAALAQCTQLKKLDFHLTDLHKLNANGWQALGNIFKQLVQIRTLCLSQTGLGYIHEDILLAAGNAIAELIMLESLSIDCNHLYRINATGWQNLEQGLVQCSRLSKVVLWFNEFQRFRSDSFQALCDLLQRTKVVTTCLHQDDFKALKKLDLQGNEIAPDSSAADNHSESRFEILRKILKFNCTKHRNGLAIMSATTFWQHYRRIDLDEKEGEVSFRPPPKNNFRRLGKRVSVDLPLDCIQTLEEHQVTGTMAPRSLYRG